MTLDNINEYFPRKPKQDTTRIESLNELQKYLDTCQDSAIILDNLNILDRPKFALKCKPSQINFNNFLKIRAADKPKYKIAIFCTNTKTYKINLHDYELLKAPALVDLYALK